MTPTARQLAADVLHRSRGRTGFAADLIDDALSLAPLSGPDRRLLTQLVFGVIRRKAALDALIAPFVRVPFHAVQPRVWDALHLGAFQLAYLTHIPRHAAVHETVDLAGYVGSPQATGFVNGILRRVAELVTDEFADAPGPDRLPVDEAGYRVLARPVLPHPEAEAEAYFAVAFSFPRWLAARWHARHGPAECRRLGFWFNAPPPLWLRVNKRHTDRETYRLRLAADRLDADPGPHPQSLRLTAHHPVRDLPGYAAGDFAVQDHSSMLVASAAGVQPGMRVLDLCAAPGGKTTHLAELLDGRGTVVACDSDPHRLFTVTTLCQRMKADIVETVLVTPDGDPPAGPFDAAVVDVPCSNTGVIGRRPEVRWRLKPGEFEHLVRLQTKLLFQAVERVRPGGVVVYSTCSIEPDENGGVVAAVRRGLPKVRVEAEHVSIPGSPSDGGYWARLRLPG